MLSPRLLLLLGIGHLCFASAQEVTLESRRLHLGRSGQYEWEEYKNRAVDAERLELHFEMSANSVEHTLRIWQRDVKQSWPVLLNGRKLGTLMTTSGATAMEHLLAIPTGALKTGGNILTIEAPLNLDDIEVGPVSITPKPMHEVMSGAQIDVTVTDGATGDGLPCRLTLTRSDGTLQSLRAEPVGEVAVRPGVVYTRRGRAMLSLPPGKYVLYAGRGFEWGVEKIAFTLDSGEVKPVALKLLREVPTAGWVAADSHIHTLTYSGHGDAKVEERMLTIAGEGIELAIATDHNHHTDYAPSAANAGVADRFTSVVGNEVTTKHGHFNAFPIQAAARVVDANEQDWGKLVPAIRATPGVRVITLNHPRDLHSGFTPFGGVQFNPKTGRHRQAEALDVDAVEVVTSAAMQSDVHLLFRDWFALLNRGHRIAAIASSDTHDVDRFILGQGRTYVAAQDANPTRLDLDEVWRSYQEGRLLVSLGLLTQVKVNGRFGVGDLATGLGESIEVEVQVFGPAWVQADHVELYLNGKLIREQEIREESRSGQKARVIWKIAKPLHDAHLVVIATGPGVSAPFWEIPRPYQPSSKALAPRVLGATNPIWIDAEGDGRYESPFAIAQRLIHQTGGNAEKLREFLKRHDEAVAIQVESLLSP